MWIDDIMSETKGWESSPDMDKLKFAQLEKYQKATKKPDPEPDPEIIRAGASRANRDSVIWYHKGLVEKFLGFMSKSKLGAREMKMVLAIFLEHKKTKQPKVEISYSEFERKTGIRMGRIPNLINALEAKGLIERFQQYNGPNKYRLNIKDIVYRDEK